jgi:Protein of unknown function (DUF4239)
MDSVVTGVAVAAVTFAGGLGGLALRGMLPEKVKSGAMRDMTGAVGGLLTLLTALVLGLLIWTAYGVYSTQSAAVRTLAVQVLGLDVALADYGPETTAGRTQLRDSVSQTLARIWGKQNDGDFVARNYGETISNLHTREAYLLSLHPNTDGQKQALTAATQAANSIAQTRLQMAVALTDPVSRPLVTVVVAWAVLIFVGFGLMHAGDLAAVGTMAVGAIAVASAVYLVIDLSQPYSGAFQVSPAPIVQVLEQMGKPQGH